jgi:uncharacterized protein DUF5946
MYWTIPRSLDGPTTIVKPALVMSRGGLTIADVHAPASEAEYPELVRRWAREVWAAHADQQPLAREWLAAAVKAHLRR